jgi:hypothetical protein
VQVEQAPLDDGYPVMWRDFGQNVRMAYDPKQITESAALVFLNVHVPRLAHNTELRRPPA